MRFDDRLATVLKKPATGETIARIQYRQLLDLLGTSANDPDEPAIDSAYLRLAELSGMIPLPARAAMVAEPMLRLRNPRLIAQLADGEPSIAAAALSAAQLGEEQWLDLIPALPARARGMVRHRHDLGERVDDLLRRYGVFDRGLPPADVAKTAEPVTRPEPTVEEEAIEGIGAIVRRIEQFRKSRAQQESHIVNGEAPRLPLDDPEQERRAVPLESFDFATDVEGRIVWSDPPAAPMAVGLRLATLEAESPAQASRSLLAAFRRRQPVRAEMLTIVGAPAIAGEWQADATPRFDSPGGRFIGYCGRMRRPAPTAPVPTPANDGAHTDADGEADRMRQVLHELRTPVNAIQGFAEVIHQQLFGPTPHEYRALAATIASDGARMLAGFDELDRLVRLDSGALELETGDCDLAAIVVVTIEQLDSYMAQRGGGFALEATEGPLSVAVASAEAERLVWRLLATLAGATGPGEILRLKLRPAREGLVRLSVRLPSSLAARDDESLFHATASPQPQALSAGMFGAGFALRLAAAEAQAAGGKLDRRDERLRLDLPHFVTAEADDDAFPGEVGNL